MTKLCPRGKAAAKRKFKVYPSAYANAYASKICAGKIKDPSGVKRKDFKGPKPAGKKTGGKVIKARVGEMMTFREYVKDKRKNAQIGPTEEKKLQREYIKKIRGAQVGPAEEAKLMGNMKSKGGFTEKLQPYSGTYIKGNLAGHEVSNPSLSNYYKDLI